MRNVENHHQCFCAMENPIWNAPTVKNTVFANSLCFLCMPLETVCAGHWHKLLDFCFVFIFGTFHGSFCHSIKAMFVSFAFIFACTKLFHFFIWKICITSLTTQNWITNEWLFTGSCASNGFVYLFKFCSIKLKNMFVSMCEAIGLTQRDNNGEWQWVLIVPQLHWLNSHFNYFWSNLCVKWMCWSCIHCLMCCGVSFLALGARWNPLDLSLFSVSHCGTQQGHSCVLSFFSYPSTILQAFNRSFISLNCASIEALSSSSPVWS